MIKKIPSYLLEKTHQVETVVFTFLFAIVFLLFYTDYSSTAWFTLEEPVYFFFTLGFISLDVIILAISRFMMTRVSLHRHGLYLITYLGWVALEILVISILYAFVTSEYIVKDGDYFWTIYPKGLLYSSIILIIPYSLTFWYTKANFRDKTLKLFKYSDNLVSDTNGIPKGTELINLADNNGNVRLSIKMENLLFIVSQDNYIKVYYSNGPQLCNYLLRCKIKTIEESFAGSSLIRCHRSYMVNIERVRSIRKEKEGTFIDLDFDGASPIPVSKSYLSNLSQSSGLLSLK